MYLELYEISRLRRKTQLDSGAVAMQMPTLNILE